MFPTTLVEVVLIIGLLFISHLFEEGILYVLTGFVILFIDLRDTTNGTETLIFALIGVYMIYYGATKKR